MKINAVDKKLLKIAREWFEALDSTEQAIVQTLINAAVKKTLEELLEKSANQMVKEHKKIIKKYFGGEGK